MHIQIETEFIVASNRFGLALINSSVFRSRNQNSEKFESTHRKFRVFGATLTAEIERIFWKIVKPRNWYR